MPELTMEQALQRGVEAHKSGKVQEADRYYTAILKAQPRHPDANHNMGILAVGIGKVEQALPFFKTALEVNQTVEQFWLSYIDALIKFGRFEGASSVLAQARAKNIKSKALDALEEQLKNNSQNIQDISQEQLKPLFDLYSQGMFQQAIDQASELLLKFPESFALHNICGASYAALKNHDAAIACHKQILRIKPENAEAFYNIGNSLKDKGDLELAIESYQKALKIKHDFTEAYNNLGNALQQKGDLKAAIKSYQKALKFKPDYVEFYNNIGNALYEKGELESSIERYKQAIKINPDYADAYSNLGTVLRKKGELEASIESYKQAIKINPDCADAYNNLGNVLQESGDLETAMNMLKKALEIMPDYAEAYNNMGVTLFKKGEVAEAVVDVVKVSHGNRLCDAGG